MLFYEKLTSRRRRRRFKLQSLNSSTNCSAEALFPNLWWPQVQPASEKEGAIKFKLCFYDHDYEVAEKPVYFYFTTARQEKAMEGGGKRLYFSVLKKPRKGRNLKIWWFLKGPILGGKQLHFGVGIVHSLGQPTNEKLWQRHVDFDIY